MGSHHPARVPAQAPVDHQVLLWAWQMLLVLAYRPCAWIQAASKVTFGKKDFPKASWVVARNPSSVALVAVGAHSVHACTALAQHDPQHHVPLLQTSKCTSKISFRPRRWRLHCPLAVCTFSSSSTSPCSSILWLPASFQTALRRSRQHEGQACTVCHKKSY